MALAAHPGAGLTDARSTAAAYGPASALGVLCDHLIDHAEDHALLNHSYVPYLGSPTARPLALHDLADRATRGVRQLRNGERHTVILAAMAAMFLSRQQASSRENTGAGAAILEALGPPAPQLLIALRVRQRIQPHPPHNTVSSNSSRLEVSRLEQALARSPECPNRVRCLNLPDCRRDGQIA